ncbi:MAG: hypothetical protein MUF52_16180 [Syntrophobacteraceae bacterium]|nr:hypothetical protein [Syntrophobacteraceae bacterium]
MDEGKIVVYGAIDPLPSIGESMTALAAAIESADAARSLRRGTGRILLSRLGTAERLMARGRPDRAAGHLRTWMLRVTDGCRAAGKPHRHDWVTDCMAQDQIYWGLVSTINLMNVR